MAKKKKSRYDNNKEPFNRHCPICGDTVKKGTPTHHCSDNTLSRLENECIEMEKELEKEFTDIDRSYCDKMDELNYYLNNDDE
jgi:hypothetical protein